MTNTETVDVTPLLDWMHERQRIYLRRKSFESPPWTDDPILRSYHFCNVYREQDRTTQWIHTHWRRPFHQHKNLWFAMCVARLINWTDTLKDIGFPRTWRPQHVARVMQTRKEQGLKNYTSAYMLCSAKSLADKHQYTVFHILDPLWQRVKTADKPPWLLPKTWKGQRPTLQQAWEWLILSNGFGPFLAYEVVTDLRHTRYLHHATDKYTWANAGPGALRGLNRLHGRDLYHTYKKEQALTEMRVIFRLLDAQRNPAILPVLELRDVEHSLCEFDKYQRVKQGLTSKRRFALRRFPSGKHLTAPEL